MAGFPLKLNIKYEIVISEWKSNVYLSTRSCISSIVFAECGYSVAPYLSKGNTEKITKLSLKEKAHKIGLEFGKVNNNLHLNCILAMDTSYVLKIC